MSERNPFEDFRDGDGFRTVIIEQNENGYGLTVSGENPVSVEAVKDGGPAALAGVKKGDSLIRVNDKPVSKYNHKEVVSIIKSTQRVKLTLRNRELDGIDLLPNKLLITTKSDLITDPKPVSSQLQTQLEGNKVKMLRVFLEKQKKVKESILAELEKNPTKLMHRNLTRELETVNRQINNITEQLSANENEMKSLSRSLHCSRSPPPSTHPHSFHPYPKQHTRSASEVIAPPLPARNRGVLNPQISAPAISNTKPGAVYNVQSGIGSSSGVNNPLTIQSGPKVELDSELPPPLPPKPSYIGEDHVKGPDTPPKSSSIGHSSSSGSDSSQRLSHTRTKSSTDAIQINSALSCPSDSTGDLSGSSWTKEPPGTPPPPYGIPCATTGFVPTLDDIRNENVVSPLSDPTPCSVREWSTSILTMEEDDGDAIDDHGPFRSLSKLVSSKYNAYMAVFVNFVISSYNPASLFFYLITDLYKEGGLKEMKKWAYEIHSSFLVPNAPMKLANVDENVLHEIDETLLNSLDKEEILRKVFWKARQRAREDLNEQLADFRAKKSAGLGSLFGPADHLLDETISNKYKESIQVEQLLVPILDSVSADLKNQDESKLMMAASLATILWKFFNLKGQQSQQLIDRCPLFVNKSPFKPKFLRTSKKQTFKEHHFLLHTYHTVIFCNHCGNIVGGFAPQGYHCSACEMNVHKNCVKNIEETCVGVNRPNERTRDSKLGSLFQKILPEDNNKHRKASLASLSQIGAQRVGLDVDIYGHQLEIEPPQGDKLSPGNVSKEHFRRSDPGGTVKDQNGEFDEELDQFPGPVDDADHASPEPLSAASDNPPNNISKGHHKKRSMTAVARSESCKEKQNVRKQLRENRKNSDPNIPTNKSGDVDGEALNFPSGSSSNSSLSQSHESPPGNTAEQMEAIASALDNDSDVEAEPELPDWASRLSPETLERLSSKDRKRQETVNEFFHTEQSHVRILKVLQYLFHQPLRQSGYLNSELLDSLFPNLDQILRLHISFNKAMKRRRQEYPLVKNIGDICFSMFDGEEGSEFQCAAAEFVACQGFALERLKQQQKRDPKLAQFLQDQENHPHCRRLQLKDMLPTSFQRLTKYPLLLESILSYTDRSSSFEEYSKISRALERSKEILAHVNKAVHAAENHKRLKDIQKRLDQSALVKNKHAGTEDLKGELDLTKHRLIHEGPLTWKTSRGQKNVELHVLVLNDCVVFLQKDSDKYVLKYHAMNKSLTKEESKHNLAPVIKFGPSFFCREVATEKCGMFFILTQSSSNAIYEMVASSPADRVTFGGP